MYGGWQASGRGMINSGSGMGYSGCKGDGKCWTCGGGRSISSRCCTINRGAVVVKIVAAAGKMQMIKVATSTAGGLAVVASSTAIRATRHWVIRGAAAVGVTSVEVVTVT